MQRLTSLFLTLISLCACSSQTFSSGDATAADGAITADSRTLGDSGATSDATNADGSAALDGTACSLPLALCGGECVDTSKDDRHCGKCDRSCDPTQLCQAGACKEPTSDCRTGPGCGKDEICNLANGQCKCVTGTHRCGSSCVKESPQSCGPNCLQCPSTNNGFAVCENGACATRCNTGFHSCSGSCVTEGPQSCGASCQVCPSPPVGADAICQSGACSYRCRDGLLKCQSGCCKAVDLAAGLDHTCALTSDGGVKCWGKNDVGQLGDGTRTNRSQPTFVSGLNGQVAEIKVGIRFSCARTTAGQLKCWGSNHAYRLGIAASSDQLKPVTTISADVIKIDRGFNASLAKQKNGTTLSWGPGFGTLPSPTLLDIDATSLGFNTCYLFNGAISCSSWSEYDDSIKSGASWLSAPASHGCAVVAGAAKCWGYNNHGQLGDGTNGYRTTVADVTGLGSGVNRVYAGTGEHAHSCALLTNGSAKCWGNNYFGELGDGTKTERHTPIAVPGLSNVKQLALGANHTCALLNDGSIRCWGRNSSGQLGDGTTTLRSTPVALIGD
ncbi:MAG: hypothetical protein H6707_17645 [Deltaproteobacteria bacterium]|nr:hypothetical protein [Deltaproteobacteria bacterium]